MEQRIERTDKLIAESDKHIAENKEMVKRMKKRNRELGEYLKGRKAVNDGS